MPALLAGVSLAFARSLGEFGAIIFIAGNQPFETEITALLAFIRLEEYDYQAAAAIASVHADHRLRHARRHQHRCRRGRCATWTGAAHERARAPQAAADRRQSAIRRALIASACWWRGADRARAARRHRRTGLLARPRHLCREHRASGHAARHLADGRHGADRRAGQHRLRHRRGLGHHQVRFPGRKLPHWSSSRLPFSISPIVAGVAYLFVYGLQGLFGPAAAGLRHQDPVRAARHRAGQMFVTAPFVARELIPLMQAQGRDLEEAATSLGASAGAPSSRSRCPTSAGRCSTVSCCATPASWASSAPSPSSRATSAARPTRCRCTSSCSTTTTTRSAPSPPLPSSPCSPSFTIVAKVALERQGAGRARLRWLLRQPLSTTPGNLA
jgi:ABC-type molybdate transport system permease subunit